MRDNSKSAMLRMPSFLESRNCDPLLNKREICHPSHAIHKRKQSQRVINDLDNVDFISSNVSSYRQEALLYVFEDNEAVNMIFNGRNPTLRHISRTHRVALDLIESLWTPISKSDTFDTKNQLADILTNEWNHLLCLLTLAVSVLSIVLK